MLDPNIVVHQRTKSGDLIETHVFHSDDGLIAWLESQEVAVYLEVEPRDEFVSVRAWSPDYCEVCGKKVADFEPGGFEREDGQRGHFACGNLPDSAGAITCSNPEVEHPGFACAHPPFDPYA